MHGTFDSRPPHQRLEGFSVRHLTNLLRHLCGGSIGFDPSRDERTNSKEKMVEFIRSKGDGAAIDAASEAARAEYGDGQSFHSRRRGRRFNGASRANAAQGTEHGAQGAGTFSAAHSAGATYTFDAADAATEGEVKAMASGATFKPAPINGDAAAQLAALIASLAGNAVNEARVREISADAVSSAVSELRKRIEAAEQSQASGVRAVEIKQGELPPINVGIQHKQFELLLKVCNTRLRDGHRLNAWLAGGAGTGKTTAAKNVAKALGLPFWFNGAIDSPYKLSGFIDGHGVSRRTAFREAYEHGGVYLFDEVDASSPGAVLEFNAALANGVYSFPDKIVERHPDCVIIAGANTSGLGASLEYVGRMKQDAAALDRFVFIQWELDEALEKALCANSDWHARVVAVRKAVKARGIRGAMVTPRATLYGEALLASGIDQATVETLVLRKGITDDQWSQVR